MKKLSNVDIKKLFPTHVYKRGLDYYKKGFVTDLIYDINHELWSAVVLGSEEYYVEINLRHMAEGSIYTECDCPAFDMYSTCKHIAAVMIKIATDEVRDGGIPSDQQYRVANHFMDAISALYPTQPASGLQERIPIAVEYFCKLSRDNHLLIELKTGIQRSYVVKDITQFLEDVLHDEEHTFTKLFTYSPENHYVLQQDLDIFEQLYSVLENEQIYNRYSFYRYQENINGERSIMIPPLVAKDLLEKLVKRNFTVTNGNNVYEGPTIEHGNLPYEFELNNNENDLILSFKGISDMIFLKPYQILFHHGIFYFPNKEQLPVINQLMQFGFEYQHLPIKKEQADMFLSEVVPSLKKVGKMELTENIRESIINEPLRATLYLEMKDSWIVGKLEYIYGEYHIDPFNRRDHMDVLIIRDVDKERKIMNLIEHANFHYNGTDLYIEADEGELYEFLYKIMPLLDEYVELFLTSDIRSLFIQNEPIPSTNIHVESSTNLLEIGFDIDGVDEGEIKNILNAVIERKNYYRLQSGAILSLESEKFTSMKQLFHDLNIKRADIEDGNIKMPAYRGVQVDELMDMKKNYDPSFQKLLHRLHAPDEQHYELPESLQATLRNYQMTGYQWFKSLSAYHLGGILADDMGLGKTLQSIAYLTSEKSDQPHLVIAPSSVVYNWKNEFHKFSPSMDVVVLTGNPTERHERMEQSKTADVWITSYATLRQDIDLYKEMSFHILILDEAQYIKNYATKTSQAIRKLTASRKFALSGTPIENSIDELWAIFQVILPGFLPSRQTFKQLSYEKIASLTKPFILRRLKKDVLKELPEKIESVNISELTMEQKELYIAYLRRLQQESADSIRDNGFQQSRMKILAGLTRLRQLCCHPGLFIENYDGKSGKLEQLVAIVQNAITNGNRLLIFSQFTSMHEIIIQELDRFGIDYFYLHGQTPSENRVQMTERFNSGEKNVFLVSLKAGGTGLNLTGADTVILYDLWWNPAVEDQATGRAHRFGQKNVVQVIRLISEGTIEEKIYELQQKKRELIDQIIQPGETMLSSLTEEDIRELLSI